MTTIKASCPACGEVEMTSKDVSLMVCSHPPLSYYAFACPSCHDEIRKPADDHVIAADVWRGACQVWELPAEALEPKVGPALDYDDLLDFALQLAAEDMIVARVSGQIAR